MSLSMKSISRIQQKSMQPLLCTLQHAVVVVVVNVCLMYVQECQVVVHSGLTAVKFPWASSIISHAYLRASVSINRTTQEAIMIKAFVDFG